MMKYFLLHLFMILTTLSGALSITINESNNTQISYVESRITVLDNNTYFLNWSEDGQEHTARDAWLHGVRRVQNNTFSLLELDPHYAQRIRILESDSNGQFVTLGLTVLENPLNPYPSDTVPLRACVNSTKLFNGRRFEVPNTFCNEGSTQYYVGRIPFNNEFIVRFEEHPRPYVWWLGEQDPDGTFGQGGIGDGVDQCEYVFADTSLNQTKTPIGSTFTMGVRWDKEPGAGCSASTLRWEARNNSDVWVTIPGSTFSSIIYNCTGVSCTKSSPSILVWYYKNITCTAAGNKSVRGNVVGSPVSIADAPNSHECYNPVQPVAEEVAAWWVYALPLVMMLSVYLIVKRVDDGDDL